MQRTYWAVNLDEDYIPADGDGRRVTSHVEANCVSSLLEDGNHAPILDLDISHEYVPSSTPGHAHLYLNVSMSWRKYRRLLKALRRAGILEDGYVKSALRRGHNEARLPHIRKKPVAATPIPPAPAEPAGRGDYY